MNIKPHQVVLDSEKEEKKEPSPVAPHVVDATEALDTSMNIEEEEINNIGTPDALTFKSAIIYFSSLSGVLLALFIFTTIFIVINTLKNIREMLISGNILDYFLLSGVFFLAVVLVLYTYKSIKSLNSLKNNLKTRRKFEAQRIEPNKKIISLAEELIQLYKNRKEKDITNSIKHIKNEIKSSQIFKEIYDDLDEKLLASIDKEADKKIRNASVQTAISTAASPIPLLDMILIIWRSVVLTKQISELYGYRPGGFSTLVLLKRGIFNVTFAGVTSVALDHSHEIIGTTVLSKISTSVAQGVTYGVLLARLGNGIVEACRPIPPSRSRSSFIKSVRGAMISSMKGSNKKENHA